MINDQIYKAREVLNEIKRNRHSLQSYSSVHVDELFAIVEAMEITLTSLAELANEGRSDPPSNDEKRST